MPLVWSYSIENLDWNELSELDRLAPLGNKQRPPRINVRWWVQLIGHLPFVGLPIAASIGSGVSRADGTGAGAPVRVGEIRR